MYYNHYQHIPNKETNKIIYINVSLECISLSQINNDKKNKNTKIQC